MKLSVCQLALWERRNPFLKGLFLFIRIFANYKIKPKLHICNWPDSEDDSTDLCGCQRDPWVYIHFVDYSDCILLPWLGTGCISVFAECNSVSDPFCRSVRRYCTGHDKRTYYWFYYIVRRTWKWAKTMIIFSYHHLKKTHRPMWYRICMTHKKLICKLR